jgi:hypothetical protein
MDRAPLSQAKRVPRGLWLAVSYTMAEIGRVPVRIRNEISESLSTSRPNGVVPGSVELMWA